MVNHNHSIATSVYLHIMMLHVLLVNKNLNIRSKYIHFFFNLLMLRCDFFLCSYLFNFSLFDLNNQIKSGIKAARLLKF